MATNGDINMATTNGEIKTATNGSIIPELTDQTCICSLCIKTYNLPKVLPCLHTFCTTCLENYISKSVNQNGQKHFQCPSCELQVEIPNGSLPGKYANAFPDDTFMFKLVESFNVIKDDKTCDICERREENIPAVNWCIDCYDALCETCLKVHLHGKITSGHVVMSLEEMKKLPIEVVMKKKNKVPCAKHNELITLFCVDCREPLCVQCMAVSHRRCENVITVADAMSSRSDVNDVMEKLESLQLSLDSADGHGQSESILEDSIRSARTRIVSVCNSLCEKVREQEAQLLHQLDQYEEESRKILKSRVEPRKTGVKTIKSANERMKTLMRYGSDVEILLAYNQVKKQLDSCQSSLADADMNSVKVQVHFQLDETVNTFMQEFDKIGEVSIDAGASDEGLSSWGVTYNSADDIIVTDCRNKRIQKFSKMGDLVDYVQLEDEPRDITTCYNNDDVAITLIGKLIIFLTTRKAMQLIKRAKTERQYDGICYSEREGFLLVSSIRERVVDAIRLDGSVIRTFERDANGQYLFAEPRYVCGSPEGTVIVADVTKNAVICLAADGRKLFEYHPDGARALKRPQCVCVDKIGNIFLADHGNNRVQLLTNDGVFQREVLGEESGLERPVALRVTNSNRMIIVQSDGMVKVFSYS